ncbi:MAG TPA: nitrous oxide reductase family maturation protein NosD [Gemmatimonadota bacterium]|nr:nitrous oxide reductase family maturation protein NosD [Gemmatimonadota bacterium]
MSGARLLSAVLAAFAIAPLPPAAAQSLWRVSPDGPLTTVASALERAAAGDTVRVAAGVYRERLVIRRPVILIGEGRPVLDGGGEGHVVDARAPLTIRGFVLRNSGTRPEREEAGIVVEDAPARIEDNRIEDVLYGIHLKRAPGSLVRGNQIRGKPLPIERRGDGIRLWYSDGTRIVGNTVEGTRDVVVYFSNRLLVQANTIADGRYGLHTMYSHRGRFLDNLIERNDVGAFLMYSEGLLLQGNVFAEADGASGMGLGLKDTEDVRAVGNAFVGNAIGVHLDNSPRSEAIPNDFLDNAFMANEVAVRLLPSVRGNRLRGNSFVGNRRPAVVAGGSRSGQAGQNDWRGNYWSEYAGFDENGDGIGDSPFEHVRLGDELLGRHPALTLFSGSPALALLNVLGRFLPLLQPEPVVIDPAPRLAATAARAWHDRGHVIDGRARPGKGIWPATLWVMVVSGSIGMAWRSTRSPRR